MLYTYVYFAMFLKINCLSNFIHSLVYSDNYEVKKVKMRTDVNVNSETESCAEKEKNIYIG